MSARQTPTLSQALASTPQMPPAQKTALDPSELEFIIAHLRYGDDNSQYHAAHTLATMAVVAANRQQIGQSNAVNALASLLSSSNARMRGLVLSALANLAVDGNLLGISMYLIEQRKSV